MEGKGAGVGVIAILLLAGLGAGLAKKEPELPGAAAEPQPVAEPELPEAAAVTKAKVAAIVVETQAGVDTVQASSESGTGAALASALQAPAVVSGEVDLQEAAVAIANVTAKADAAVVARALGYAPVATTEELDAMTPGEDKAYSYGVSEEVGELMAGMTGGELYAYCQEHGI